MALNQEPKNTSPAAPAVVPDFSVSAMPKEFRGKAGLARMSLVSGVSATTPPTADTGPIVSMPAPVAPSSAPAMPASAAPAPAALEMAPPPTAKVHPRMWWIAGAIIILMAGFAAWALWPSAPAPTPAPRPAPVVQKPAPAPAPKPVEPPTPKPVPPPAEVGAPGRDTDSDGLTNVEEVLYGTIPTRPDTDGDGFLDGNEVFHLYHPNGLAPQTLLDTGFVIVYSSPIFPYQFHVPKRWRVTELADERKVSLSSTTGETIAVQLRIIDPGQSLQEWRKTVLIPQVTGAGEVFKTKSGFDGVWEADHLTGSVRVSSGEVLVFTYTLDTATTVEYRQTFEMILNSLQRIPSAP